MLHAATRMYDFVGAHGRVADEDQLVIAAVGVHQVIGGNSLAHASGVVLPDGFVDEVVKVVVLQVLELRACSGEKFLTQGHVLVHGAADVEKQQHLHVVVAFRH